MLLQKWHVLISKRAPVKRARFVIYLKWMVLWRDETSNFKLVNYIKTVLLDFLYFPSPKFVVLEFLENSVSLLPRFNNTRLKSLIQNYAF